jgi:tetratricopeptide (TPR) repeat protein
MDERVERSRLLYERALHEADRDALAAADRELDAAEADLALARGRVLHGRFLEQRASDPASAREDPRELALFERASRLYQHLGDLRGEAEALFWIGCCHQVVRRDNDTAVPVLDRSLLLAEQAGDQRTMAEALRHLGIADHAAGRLDAARTRLEESAALRHQAGQPVGVAANQVGLAYIAAAQGRRDDALAILGEAAAITTAHGAPGIRRQIDEARAAITAAGDPGPA